MQLTIGLRAYQKEDLDAIYTWPNDPDLAPFFMFTTEPYTRDKAQQFLDLQLYNTDPTAVHFVIYDLQDLHQTYRGTVGLKNIDKTTGTAEIAIVISDPAYRGKGLGQQALFLICQYGFSMLGLSKININFISHNVAADKSYRRFGFQDDGVSKKKLLQNGVQYDEIHMSLTSHQFANLYENTHST
ncbi:GNAT family N-acetyltransferase [Candidatus Roizmanbacteria bacterium]|nr:GNAT family N-acetyltransferase [Candidatus Roizmanbacteria bacterium]